MTSCSQMYFALILLMANTAIVDAMHLFYNIVNRIISILHIILNWCKMMPPNLFCTQNMPTKRRQNGMWFYKNVDKILICYFELWKCNYHAAVCNKYMYWFTRWYKILKSVLYDYFHSLQCYKIKCENSLWF